MTCGEARRAMLEPTDRGHRHTHGLIAKGLRVTPDTVQRRAEQSFSTTTTIRRRDTAPSGIIRGRHGITIAAMIRPWW